MGVYTEIKQFSGKVKQKENVFFLLNICHVNLLWTFTTVRQTRNKRDTKYRATKSKVVSDLYVMLIKYSSSAVLHRHLEINQLLMPNRNMLKPQNIKLGFT